jgi:hypothetical protein
MRRTKMNTIRPVLYILAFASCLFLQASTSVHAQSSGTEKLQNIRKLIVLLGGLYMQRRSLQDELTCLNERFPQLRAEYGEALAKREFAESANWTGKKPFVLTSLCFLEPLFAGTICTAPDA